jgi:hypothetical protein
VLHRHVGAKMKKLIYLIACIALTAISCGVVAAVPTVQPTEAIGHITETVVSASVETVNKDSANIQFITTAQLHVRSCASVDCAVLAYLAAGDSVIVTVRGITGPGCAGAEWYAVEAGGVAGFVCSIYVTEAK